MSDIQSILVTVGTTKFTQLTDQFQKDSSWLKTILPSLKQVTIQHGNSPFTTPQQSINVIFEAFPFTDTLDPYIQRADLIISHAGSGSILECLRRGKRLVVVVNETLMDNHQWELAEELCNRGHLLACTVKDLEATLKQLSKVHKFTPYPPANIEPLQQLIKELLR